jgi:hypothetical protein
VLIYRTPDGLARGHGDDVLLLDLPYRDLGDLLTAAADRHAATSALADAAVRTIIPILDGRYSLAWCRESCARLQQPRNRNVIARHRPLQSPVADD